MKKIFTMILAAASIFAALSCNRTFDEKEVPTDGTIYVTRTYKAGLDEPTKTTIDAAGKVTWEQGDLIRYYSQKNGEVKEYTIPEGAAHADLTLDVASTASFLIGVYGGTSLTDNLGSSVTIQGAIPAEQTGVFGDHHVAITKTYDVTQQSLTFHNIVSYLKFTLTRTDVAKVVFKANDATQLTGDGIRVSFVSDSEAIDDVAFIGTGSNSITVNNGGAGTFYIATLPCTIAGGFQADCYDATGIYLGSVTTSKSVEVKPGKVLNLGIIDTRMEQLFTDLSAAGTANSYLVSEPGHYKFKANVKGNSTTALDGTPARARVLWESFGTDETPSVGDIVSGVTFNEGYIQFTSGKNGNAVIAVENRDEDILWSWHIWVCDGYDPASTDQVYNNGAGTMMDRNLGATSATPGDVHALGLLYQWGRKDPFLSGDSISYSSDSDQSIAKSTASWPSAVESSPSYGTIDYSISHPMTFVAMNSLNSDWYYTGDSTTDNTRWKTTDKAKTMYDPCPVGYRVPDGGVNGVWARAFGINVLWSSPTNWDPVNKGINFGSTDYSLGSGTIWYPAAGYRSNSSGSLCNAGYYGYAWSSTTIGYRGYRFGFNDPYVLPAGKYPRYIARSVRCYKENTSEPVQYTDLSDSATANSYIVTTSGNYKIKAVKGNTSTSVGSVATAEVLWESLGTDEETSVGDLIQEVNVDGTYITFAASRLKGNALIAAKDASGTILWSWHIWLTDQPVDQVYNNGAGTMMDRNLGATSATKGDVKALGLLYQWGRKDPFLGGDSITYSEETGQSKAKSTAEWPSTVNTNATNGTIAYTVLHPMTFVTSKEANSDWLYTGDSTNDDTRWKSTDNTKTMYDPCPAGYRVPDGGDNGIWANAIASQSNLTNISNWDAVNMGMDFGQTVKTLGTGTIWYPSSGYMGNATGSLCSIGIRGYTWSSTVSENYGLSFKIMNDGSISRKIANNRADGMSVRCYKEGSSTFVPVTAISLNKTSASIENGKTVQLTATVTPTNATNKTVTWSTSNSSIATVSSTGLVTAKAVGTCTITATSYNGLKATCAITVAVPVTDLSASGTANSYIVSAAGTYKIKTVKGNTTTSVGTVASASVLWESYGTSTKPAVGDLISGVKVDGNYITFTASAKKGNAVIAAKNSSGTILWSWHIWLTDKPADQVYRNSAGTMMDRNLGATSATKGDGKALGLLYQWGRKDPFLGGYTKSYSSSSGQTKASSTGTWPSAVASTSSNGTTAYAIAHPMTFIKSNSYNLDWYYSNSSSTDNTRWRESSKSKGLYDPCPVGYRVPDGGSSGIWAVAFGSSSTWKTASNWDSTNKGMNFGATDIKLGSGTIWYPASGYLYQESGGLAGTGYNAYYWSSTPNSNSGLNSYHACDLWFYSSGNIYPWYNDGRANAQSVRCMKEKN